MTLLEFYAILDLAILWTGFYWAVARAGSRSHGRMFNLEDINQ